MAKTRAEITRDQKKRYKLAGFVKIELMINSADRSWFLEKASESRRSKNPKQKKAHRSGGL